MNKARACIVVIAVMVMSAAFLFPVSSESEDLDAGYAANEIDRELVYSKVIAMVPGDEAGVYAKMDGADASTIIEKALEMSEPVLAGMYTADVSEAIDFETVSAEIYAKIVMGSGNVLQMDSGGFLDCSFTIQQESGIDFNLYGSYDASGIVKFTEDMVPDYIDVEMTFNLVLSCSGYETNGLYGSEDLTICLENTEHIEFPDGMTNDDVFSAFKNESHIGLEIDACILLFFEMEQTVGEDNIYSISYNQSNQNGISFIFDGQILDQLETFTPQTAAVFNVLSQDGKLFTLDKAQVVSRTLNHELTQKEYDAMKMVAKSIVDLSKEKGLAGFYYKFGEKTVHSTVKSSVDAVKSSVESYIGSNNISMEYLCDKDESASISLNHGSLSMYTSEVEVTIPTNVRGHTVDHVSGFFFLIDPSYSGEVKITVPSSIRYVYSIGLDFYDSDGVTELNSDEIPGHTYIGTSSKVIKQALSKYTVSFDTNGGSVQLSSRSVEEGNTYTLPSYSGTKEGYTFSGWKYGGTLYVPGYSFTMPSQNVSFKAVWCSNVKYSVSYDLNGGSGSIEAFNIAGGKTFNVISSKPMKNGSTFVAWTCNGVDYSPGQSVVMSESDMVFKAKWSDGSNPGSNVSDESDGGNRGIIIIAAIIGIAAAILICIVYFMTKGSKFR